MDMIMKSAIAGLVVYMMAAGGVPTAVAEQSTEQPAVSQSQTVAPSDANDHVGWGEGTHKGWDKKALLELKQKDPEKFREVMSEHRRKIRARLEYLKKTDPAKYEQLKERIRQRRFAQLKRLKEENPEKFKEIMTKRKEFMKARLEQLKTEDPAKYQRIVAFRAKMEELRRLRKEDPEKFKQYIEEHPELKERFEHRRRHWRGHGVGGQKADVPAVSDGSASGNQNGPSASRGQL